HRRGANLSLIARSEDKLRKVGGSDAVITAGDLTDDSVRRQSIEATVERFSSLDILINNAGIGLYAPTWEAPMEDVRRMTELNLFVPLEMIQLAVPHIEKQGGAIVNVGSIAGKVTLPWLTLYSMTKYGLGSLTDGLRMELKEKGIHTINVCPGYVKTRFQEHVLTGRVPPSIQRSKKFAITAEQCAEAIAKGVERDSRTVMTPGAGWMLVVLERLFPSIVDWQLHRMYRSVK
ncbi:MAG: SDR family NAD(P)-dependent oxidoreductase, partial [bacterium]|nr:SDR family NAD(P)-dependent oxidoreductase [bacterium]